MKPKTEILIKYSELVGKYPLKKIFEYLNILQKIGITNMFGAIPYLYGGRNWIQKQIDYFDIEEDENVEKLLDMADEIKDNIISGALKRQEREETNNFIRSIERRVQQESKDILKIWMDFKGKVLKESIIIEVKYNKKDAANFLFRRVTKEELDEEFEDTYEYYSDNWSKRHKYRFENFDRFKKVFTTTIMDGVHGRLIDGFLGTNDETGELYDNVFEIIDEMYGDRIARLWTQKTGERV
jgi:hypothetical protein